jgi:hypothetical protein
MTTCQWKNNNTVMLSLKKVIVIFGTLLVYRIV